MIVAKCSASNLCQFIYGGIFWLPIVATSLLDVGKVDIRVLPVFYPFICPVSLLSGDIHWIKKKFGTPL